MSNSRAIEGQQKLKETREEEILTALKQLQEKIDKIKKRKKLIIKEIVREGLRVFKIMKTNVIKELEEVELKSKKLEVVERMKESSGEFEMKMLKTEIKALEKITEIEKDIKETNGIEGTVIVEIKITTRAELEELEMEREIKIRELKLCPN